MPWWEMLLGVLETFVFSWLIGALIASIYNLSLLSAGRPMTKTNGKAAPMHQFKGAADKPQPRKV